MMIHGDFDNNDDENNYKDTDENVQGGPQAVFRTDNGGNDRGARKAGNHHCCHHQSCHHHHHGHHHARLIGERG